MRTTILRASAFLLIFCAEFVGITRSQETGQLKEWVPEKGMLKNLAPATAIEGYTIQVPKGYKLQPAAPNAPAELKMFAWAGEQRPDETKPSLLAMVITPPPGPTQNLPLEKVADKLIAAIKRLRTNWHQEKSEEGTVNGIRFIRVRWKGTNQDNGLDMEGFVYVARDGKAIIQMTSQDIVSQAKKALPLAEASILTFKKTK